MREMDKKMSVLDKVNKLIGRKYRSHKWQKLQTGNDRQCCANCGLIRERNWQDEWRYEGYQAEVSKCFYEGSRVIK